MIRLVTFDNFEFDLTGEERIAITIQQPSIDKIDTFQSDFSVTFDLPATKKNLTYLQNCDLSISNSTIPYNYINIRVYSNNIELYPNAILCIKEFNETFDKYKKIKCFLLSGVINIKALLGDKTLQQLNTESIDFSFPADLSNSNIFNDNFARGWIFTLVQRYEFVSSQNLIEAMYADVYAGRIFELIFESIGIDYEFENEPAEFKKLLICYQGKLTPLPNKDFIKNTKGRITSGEGIGNIFLLQFLLPNPSDWNKRAVNILILPNNTIPNNFIRTTDGLGLSSTIYKPIETALYKIKLSYKARASDSSRIGFYFGTTFSKDYILPIAYGAVAPLDSFSGEFFVLMLKDVEYSARVDLKTGSIVVGDYIIVTDMSFEIEAVNDIRFWQNTYRINTLLPKIKQWDFIKEICIRLGVVPKYDFWNNKVVFYNFDRLLEYDNLQDFSGKVDFLQEQKTFFYFEDFARENIFLNAEVENSNLDTASLQVLSNVLESEKTIYESKFGLPIINLYIGNNGVPFVPTKISNNPNSTNVTNLELSDADNDCYRLMLLPNNKTSLFTAVLDINRNVTALVVTNDIFICNTNNLDWQSVLNQKYKAYETFLDKTQIKQVYLLINENDLQTIDFLKPIFIKELNSFWFVHKIEQYESGLESVKCTLVRLNNVSGISIGNGVKFNGINHYLKANNSTLITSEITINAIFKPFRVGAFEQVINNAGDVFGTGLRGTWSIDLRNNGTLWCSIQITGIEADIITIPYTPNEIIHITNVITPTTVSGYKNGVLIGTVNRNYLDPVNNVRNIYIGNDSGNFYPFQGDIHDIKIFNKALNQTEITKIYKTKGNVIPQTAQSNVVLDIRFEEKTGFTSEDISGNNNNATWQNYTLLQVSLGENNHHIDKNGNPILS